jgi:hypothetical protein
MSLRSRSIRSASSSNRYHNLSFLLSAHSFLEVSSRKFGSLLQALHPFYVFQVFALLLWFLWDYYSYATVIALISACGLISEYWELSRSLRKLQQMAHTRCMVKCFRGSDTEGTPLNDSEWEVRSLRVHMTFKNVFRTDLDTGGPFLTPPSLPVIFPPNLSSRVGLFAICADGVK